MTAMSDYLENKVLDHILRNTAFTQPSALFVGLFTASPNDTGGGTEASGNGYAREAVTFAAASSGSASNSADIDFGAPSGGTWGTITHWALFDASTSGNMLVYGSLASSKVTADGDQVLFATGDLTISAD